MKRLMLLVLGGVLLSGSAFAQATGAKAPEKTPTATGSVTAVTMDSLTVKGKSAEWTFAVDKSTHVSVTGASRKTSALKDSKAPAAITEYVKVGDTVNVKYTDGGAKKVATNVVVRSSIKK